MKSFTQTTLLCRSIKTTNCAFEPWRYEKVIFLNDNALSHFMLRIKRRYLRWNRMFYKTRTLDHLIITCFCSWKVHRFWGSSLNTLPQAKINCMANWLIRSEILSWTQFISWIPNLYWLFHLIWSNLFWFFLR